MHKVLEPHKRAAIEFIEHIFTEDDGISRWKHTWPMVKADMVANAAKSIAQGDIVGLHSREDEAHMFIIQIKRKFKKPTL